MSGTVNYLHPQEWESVPTTNGAEVRRLSVHGGWLYQVMMDHMYESGDVRCTWSQPVFVRA